MLHNNKAGFIHVPLVTHKLMTKLFAMKGECHDGVYVGYCQNSPMNHFIAEHTAWSW